ncbi:MAG: CbiX/SirB N-terminal domain-containing protein [Planctomycetota bacterium]
MSSFSRSLILVAHGADDTPDSNQPILDLAQSIANVTDYDFVTAAFLIGSPQLSEVLAKVPSGDVVVVPLMTSEGYYFRQIPERLTADHNADPFRFYFARPIGVDTKLPAMVAARVQELLAEEELLPAETTVVVVGHGTRRNANSGTATRDLTTAMQPLLSPELTVKFGFIDQDPGLDEIVKQIDTQHVLVIPFLMGRGPHTTVDVPEAFGLPTGTEVKYPSRIHLGSGKIVCDLPVGALPGIQEICIETANRSMLRNLEIESEVAS